MQSLYYKQGYTEEKATASTERRESEVHPEGKVRLTGDGANCWSSASRGPLLCWEEKYGVRKRTFCHFRCVSANDPEQRQPGRSEGAGGDVRHRRPTCVRVAARQKMWQGNRGPVLRREEDTSIPGRVALFPRGDPAKIPPLPVHERRGAALRAGCTCPCA